MIKIVAATSFSASGFNEYGKIMVETFRQFWPDSVKLIVYLDDPVLKETMVHADNIEYQILNDTDLTDFKKRHKNNPEAHGLGTKASKDHTANFAFNAVKFSHKVFALLKMIDDHSPDIALWLDGDSRTHSQVTVERIESWCPENFFAGYLARPWLYTETGFHIFRLNHGIAERFFETWKNYYINDTVFKLNAWTDCHTYDAAREQFDCKLWYNLSPDLKHPHPFINGVLGEVMDHMKGPRKQKGTSHQKDLVVNRSGYWKNVT